MRATLTRSSPLLLLLCLTGCGQTGNLFLRMPLNAIPNNWRAPPLSTAMTPIVAVPGSTALAPASATVVTPTLATRPAPAASTH